MTRRLSNFVHGVRAAFNLVPRPAGNLVGDRYIPRTTAEAVRADWGAVAGDLRAACRILAETLTHEQRRADEVHAPGPEVVGSGR